MTEGADFDARLGAALREARLNAGYTQEEIARVLRVTPATIARYELGVRHLSVNTLFQIAAALEMPLSQLVPGAERLERTVLPSLSASPQQQAMQTLVRVLEERPDLVPKVLETVEAALGDQQRHSETQILTDGHAQNER